MAKKKEKKEKKAGKQTPSFRCRRLGHGQAASFLAAGDIVLSLAINFARRGPPGVFFVCGQKPRAKENPASFDAGFWDKALAMTYSCMA